jgi:hypothetical protein
LIEFRRVELCRVVEQNSQATLISPSSVESLISSAVKPDRMPFTRSREQVHWSRSASRRKHDALLVKKPDRAAARVRRSGQAVPTPRQCSQAPSPRARRRRRIFAGFCAIAAMQSLRCEPAPAHVRQELDQQAAGAPGLVRAVVARRHLTGDRKPHISRDLLRLAEIGARHLVERLAVQFDNALIALGELALVDGEGERAIAKQVRRRNLTRLDLAAATRSASKRA